MKPTEVICSRCLQPFVPVDVAAAYCPNCGERYRIPMQTAVPPPLPNPSRIKLHLAAAAAGVAALLILRVALDHWLGHVPGRVWGIFLVLLVVSYLASAALFKHPFARVFGALLFAFGIAALIVGILFGGCALIMKMLPK